MSVLLTFTPRKRHTAYHGPPFDNAPLKHELLLGATRLSHPETQASGRSRSESTFDSLQPLDAVRPW